MTLGYQPVLPNTRLLTTLPQLSVEAVGFHPGSSSLAALVDYRGRGLVESSFRVV